jgi:hypothetical protein
VVTPDLAPAFLNWDEVDPDRHPFDDASVAQVVSSLGPAQCVPRRPDLPAADPAITAWSRDIARPWADAMSHALVEHYGRWAVGWRWSHDEGDFDGGPIGNWCCPRDSITTPRETLDRAVAALCEWRGWLTSLAGWFESYPLDPEALDDQRILWEPAVRTLIVQVVDRTGCGSGWHGHCRQVLTWFLARWSFAPQVADDLVRQAIGGRFLSWTEPDTAVVDEVAEQLALSLGTDGRAPTAVPATDHLQRWLSVRASLPWNQCSDGGADGPVRASRDGAAEDIRAFDAAIAPAARTHPFDDGNARAAFLTLVFILARENVALNSVGLLRRVTFQADSPDDALALARYIDVHIAKTRRESGHPTTPEA